MKILLLSDATLCLKGGIGQTLHNIFLFADTKDFLCITSTKSFKAYPPNQHYLPCYITYQFELIDVSNNRFSKYISFLADWINYNYAFYFKSFKKIKKKIKQFNPDVIISCSNGPVNICMHNKILQKNTSAKVFPYFMDDWMYQKTHAWLNNKIYNWTKKILQENHDWLMVSKSLAEILKEKYHANPSRILEIHNPVCVNTLKLPELVKNKDKYTIAYAGALWPMHYDAFLKMSKAVQLLNKKRAVILIVYTSQPHWQWRKNDLENLGVKYGGDISYENIHYTLSNADCLLITSSFSKDWITHSKGSLQTKMTDYLKAGRLIISCGPSYSANNHFIKKYNCGICIETIIEEDAAIQLDEILNNIEELQICVKNGYKILHNDLSFEKVHDKLKEFLAA